MRGATKRRLGATLLAAALAVPVLRESSGPKRRVKVLSAGAVRAIVTELAQTFEKGPATRYRWPSAPPASRASGFERARGDRVLTDVGIDATIKEEGGIAAGTRTDIGRNGMGVGRDGAPRPDISTMSDAFRSGP